MELYLIRHGIAVERGIYQSDNDRPLTDKGRTKTRKVAQRLFSLGLKFDCLFSSKLLRAKQTAAILQDLELCSQVKYVDFLAPDGDLNLFLSWLRSNISEEEDCQVALVGHQPDLGNWAEMLVWGSSNESLIVKKAGIIGVKFSNLQNPVGNSELFLLTSPKWFG